jgi:hypothetical protein
MQQLQSLYAKGQGNKEVSKVALLERSLIWK